MRGVVRMRLYFGNAVTTATTLMILALLGFIGWSVWGRTNIHRNGICICQAAPCRVDRHARWRALVPYRGTDAVSGSLDQRTQLERCLRLMILNGVNDETRIKTSRRQREQPFGSCIHTYSRYLPGRIVIGCKMTGSANDKAFSRLKAGLRPAQEQCKRRRKTNGIQ